MAKNLVLAISLGFILNLNINVIFLFVLLCPTFTLQESQTFNLGGINENYNSMYLLYGQSINLHVPYRPVGGRGGGGGSRGPQTQNINKMK